MMQERAYSTQTWSQHELHPKQSEGFSEVDIVNFVFTMDLLNFSYADSTQTSVIVKDTNLLKILVRPTRGSPFSGRIQRPAVDRI